MVVATAPAEISDDVVSFSDDYDRLVASLAAAGWDFYSLGSADLDLLRSLAYSYSLELYLDRNC